VVGAVLERSFFYSAAHLYGIGGQLMDEDGEPTFNNEAGLAWIELLRSFDEAGPTIFFSDADLDRFKEGTAGIIFAGTWQRNELAEAIGKESLTIDGWPSYNDGSLSGFVQAQNIFVSSQTPQEELPAVVAFITHLLSPSAQAKLSEAGLIPVLKSATLEGLLKDRLILQAVRAMEKGTPYPVVPEIEVYQNPIDIALKAIFENDVPPEDALTTAEETIRQKLEEMKVAPTP
jgi:ABC-type glycerol-3-phosphate transport system substrate-binding protein